MFSSGLFGMGEVDVSKVPISPGVLGPDQRAKAEAVFRDMIRRGVNADVAGELLVRSGLPVADAKRIYAEEISGKASWYKDNKNLALFSVGGVAVLALLILVLRK
jgi:hypothetical protein